MMGHSKFWRGVWLCLGVILWLIGSSLGVYAQSAPPIVLVIDSSEEVNSEMYHELLYDAVEKVIFFIAASNPVSIVSTCPNTASMQSPTQDAAVIRTALSQISWCSRYDHGQALQTAVMQLGDQTGDIIYLVNGQFLMTDMEESLRTSTAALTKMQASRSCLYVIPIGNIVSSPNLIDRDAVQDLVNAAGCGQRYEGQKTPTIASTLLEAVLISQGRTLMMRYGEQLPLFSRATAKMNQPITITDDTQAVRIDVIWGTGALDVALQAPAASAPVIVSGEGYQSLTIADPAAGPWNIKLSVTQVPENQVAIVLFSQASRLGAPVHINEQPKSSATSVPNVAQSEATPLPADAASSPAAPSSASSLPTLAATTTASDVPTVVILMPISNTLAPTTPDAMISPAPLTPNVYPARNPSMNPLFIVAVVVIVGILGVFLVLWSRRSTAKSEPAASAGATLHSRATSELPPVPFPPNLNAPTPVSDKRRAIHTHSPVPMDAGFGDSQFRQFPALVVFKNGTQNGQVFEINSGYFMIGRHSTSDLRVQDGTVSREHARIIFDNAQNLYLIENVSQAGTQVNGQYIAQRRPLYSGDLIQVGNIQIHFQLRVHSQI